MGYDVVLSDKFGSVDHISFATKAEASAFAQNYRKGVYSLEDGVIKDIKIELVNNRPDLSLSANTPLSKPLSNPVQGSVGALNLPDKSIGQGDGKLGSPRAGGRTHKGIDIAAPEGTPVHPVLDGTVIFSDKGSNMEGYKVKVRHMDGTLSIYMHLTGKKMPKKGDQVTTKDQIGEVGRTGNVPEGAQTHLHLQTYNKAGNLVVPNIPQPAPTENQPNTPLP